jgi:hypothetical protein
VTVQRERDIGAPVVGRVRATCQQERLWQREMKTHPSEYFSPFLLRCLSGALDVAALSAALETVVARHEPLRTTFVAEGDDVFQVVREPFAVRLRAERVSDLEGELASTIRQPFDLTDGPVLRARLFAIGRDEHLLLLVVHHIAIDRWSTSLLLAELAEVYRARRDGAVPVLPELRMRYRDYAVWQRDRWQHHEQTDHARYWRGRMETRPAPLPIPVDRPRHAAASRAAGRIPVRLQDATAAGVADLSRSARTSQYVVLLSAFQVALARWTGQPHVLVGCPVANRPLPELENVIGLFANMIPLHATVGEDDTFRSFIARVHDMVLDGYEFQEHFFNHIVDSVEPSERASLVRALFAYDDATTDLWLPASFGEPVDLMVDAPTYYDVSVVLERDGSGIHGSITYLVDLLNRATVVDFVDRFLRLMGAVVDDPGRRFRELPF